jgi:hypothetical protein
VSLGGRPSSRARCGDRRRSGAAARRQPPAAPPAPGPASATVEDVLSWLLAPEDRPCPHCDQWAPVEDVDGGDGWYWVICTSCGQARGAWGID